MRIQSLKWHGKRYAKRATIPCDESSPILQQGRRGSWPCEGDCSGDDGVATGMPVNLVILDDRDIGTMSTGVSGGLSIQS